MMREEAGLSRVRLPALTQVPRLVCSDQSAHYLHRHIETTYLVLRHVYAFEVGTFQIPAISNFRLRSSESAFPSGNFCFQLPILAELTTSGRKNAERELHQWRAI
jgi:hypothetical protein